jgi:ABC-type microcin C transport system permease subunit YejB
MLQFLTRRLLLLVPVMIGILLITFAIVRLIPGDPCITMLGERATPEKCAAFMERYGLNDSIPQQFGRYIVNIVTGDLGDSLRFGRPVVTIISERLPMTIELTFCAMFHIFRHSFWSNFRPEAQLGHRYHQYDWRQYRCLHAGILVGLTISIFLCTCITGYSLFYSTFWQV